MKTQKARDKYVENCLKRREQYNSNPKKCKCCGNPLLFERRRNDYCNHSCAAKFTNRGVRRNVVDGLRSVKPCAVCFKKTDNKTFCCRKCNQEYNRRVRWETIERLGALIAYRTDKEYLIAKRGRKCEECSTEVWLGRPVPLVLDHIDGNSDNNSLSNVRLICHNCNALTETFCGKNKGNGRFSRRGQYRNQRYQEGNSY